MTGENALLAQRKGEWKKSFVAVSFSGGAVLLCIFLILLLAYFMRLFSDTFGEIPRQFDFIRDAVLTVLPVGIAAMGLSFFNRNLPVMQKKALSAFDFLNASIFVFGANFIGVLFSSVLAASLSGAGIGLSFPELRGPQNVPELLKMLLVTALLPAILEETLFRKAILQRLSVSGKCFAAVVSSLLFALSHMSPLQFFSTFSAGLVLSFYALRTGRILPSVTAHFLFNAANIGLSFAKETGDIGYFTGIYQKYMLLCGLFALFLLSGLIRKLILGDIKISEKKRSAGRVLGVLLNPCFLAILYLWARNFLLEIR